MEQDIIEKAGLSKAQANTYYSLLKRGAMTPAEIAKDTGETRTNTYALLSKMESAGLVKKIDGKKAIYEALHPSVLETIAEKRRRQASKNEESLKAGMSGLIDMFYAHSEKPSIRTFIGYNGVKDVYRDIVQTGETVYLIRTEKDEMMHDFIMKYRTEMGKKGVRTIAVMPDTREGRQYQKDGTDENTLLDRVPIPRDAYTAPVTIMSYGKKVALVVYGETEMSTIITSPAIAESIKQIVVMLRNRYL